MVAISPADLVAVAHRVGVRPVVVAPLTAVAVVDLAAVVPEALGDAAYVCKFL